MFLGVENGPCGIGGSVSQRAVSVSHPLQIDGSKISTLRDWIRALVTPWKWGQFWGAIRGCYCWWFRNHHLGCIEHCEQWDKLPINWCGISAINSIAGCHWWVVCVAWWGYDGCMKNHCERGHRPLLDTGIAIHPRRLTARPWKMMVRRRSFPFGMVIFQGRAVKLRGCISGFWRDNDFPPEGSILVGRQTFKRFLLGMMASNGQVRTVVMFVSGRGLYSSNKGVGSLGGGYGVLFRFIPPQRKQTSATPRSTRSMVTSWLWVIVPASWWSWGTPEHGAKWAPENQPVIGVKWIPLLSGWNNPRENPCIFGPFILVIASFCN